MILMVSSKGRRRNNIEIIASILRSLYYSQRGLRKTNIMYSSALNLRQLNSYLSLLLDRGLMHYDQAERVYRITADGEEYLRSFERYAKARESLLEEYDRLKGMVTANSKKRLVSGLIQ